jgi:NitT/TauT family transport system permease protein
MTRLLNTQDFRPVGLFLVIGTVLWELVGSNKTVGLLISAPSRVFNYFITNAGDLLGALAQTSLEAFAGIMLATLVCFSVMFVCFYWPSLLSALLPITALSQVVPLITLAPLFILLFGLGTLSKIMMATLICFFPIFIGFATGVRQVSDEVRTMLYVYDASVWQRVRWAYLPQSLPHLMAGLKVASTLAVIGAIVAEFNGADIGLGKNLYLAAKKLEPELMMSSLILSSVLGGALFGAVVGIERSLGSWYMKGKLI